MSYVSPKELAGRIISSGESKVFTSTLVGGPLKDEEAEIVQGYCAAVRSAMTAALLWRPVD
jgi:hypothetical protein